MTAAERHFHRSYGRASNIPPCCIEFWIGRWTTWRRRGREDLRQAHRVAMYATGIGCVNRHGKPRDGWGYIPCTACLVARRHRQVNHCPPPEPWNEPWVPDNRVSRRWTRDIRLVSIPVDRLGGADRVAA